MHRSPVVSVDGICVQDFAGVRDAFERNFSERADIGAAVAVGVGVDLVVNLWVAAQMRRGSLSWRADPLAPSVVLTSTCIHLLANQDDLDLDVAAARYWPGSQISHHRRHSDRTGGRGRFFVSFGLRR